jgi:hypothetical protein
MSAMILCTTLSLLRRDSFAADALQGDFCGIARRQIGDRRWPLDKSHPTTRRCSQASQNQPAPPNPPRKPPPSPSVITRPPSLETSIRTGHLCDRREGDDQPAPPKRPRKPPPSGIPTNPPSSGPNGPPPTPPVKSDPTAAANLKPALISAPAAMFAACSMVR